MAAADDINRINREISDLASRLGKGPFKVFDPTEIQEAKAALKGLRAELADITSDIGNVALGFKNIVQEIQRTSVPLADAKKSFRSLSSLASQLQSDQEGIKELTEKELTSLVQKIKQERVNLQQTKSLLDSKRVMGILTSEEETALDEINAILQGNDGLYKGLLITAKERLKVEEKINKQVRGFTALKDLAESIPGLRAFAGPFQEAEKAARKVAKRGGETFEIFKAGGKALAKAFGPITLLIGAFQGLVKLLFEVDKQVTEIGKAQALSVSEANNYREQIQAAAISSKSLVDTTKNLLESQSQLAKSAGATRGFTIEELKAQTALTKRVGVQAEIAAKLANLSRIQGQTSEQALESIIESTVALQQQTGIQLDNRDVLDEVANTQGQLAANYKNAPNLIAAAVVQTRRLGLTLSQAADMSSKLLDFESSIEAELEAELLTGRSINLERARALALQGKSAEAAAELAKNFGSLEEFQNMSVIAQNALAKSMGMTSDELANALQQQANLNKLGETTKKQIQDRVDQLRREGRAAEANALLSKSVNEATAKEILFRQDAQDKFNAALDKAKDIFSSIIDSLPVLSGILAGIAVTMAGLAISALVAANALTLGGASIAIGAGVAAGIGTYFAAKQMATQDIQDGVIAPDGGLIVTGKKGSIQLDKNDSIVAGTNLRGNNSNDNSQLLKRIDRLIEVVEKGGNVYLDSNKVGYSLALASTKQ